MSQVSGDVAISTGQKRGPGRPSKAGLTPNKRQKRETASTDEPSLTQALTNDAPAPEKKQRGLPTKLSDNRPLPTLLEAQSLALPDAEYASIADSGVLAKSLEQSRTSWTQTGVFDRYWVKPETGKNAKPPPPQNPDVKSMKSRGRCRLRIEPHIFEVEIYVVEKPRPPPQPAPKQYLPPRPQGNFQQPWQNHPQAPAWSASNAGSVHQPQQPIQPSPTAVQERNKVPDPVIALLAQRAGSDPELKALMREVAAGNAPPEQLKVFQRHIDELQAQLRAQKLKEEEQTRIQSSTTTANGHVKVESQQPRPFVPPPTQYAQPQKYVPPPPPPPGEVVFAFTTPGASSDRFLFPQHCIIEALTPQHLLTSFLVLRAGKDATNAVDIDSLKTYWTPITIMVEVAYGREGILKDIQRWVKSGDESREYMKKVMADNDRIPETHLALRLPFKGTAGAESTNTSKVSTPVPPAIEEKKRRQSKDPLALSKKRSSLAKETPVDVTIVDAPESSGPQKEAVLPETVVKTETTDATPVESSQRPTRTTRKSVRISDI